MRRLLLLALCMGCGSSTPAPPPVEEATNQTIPPGAEARSLLGKPLYPPPLDNAEKTKKKVALVEARARLREQPNDPARLLEVGERLMDLYRFRDAAQVFTQGVGSAKVELFRERGRARLGLRDFSGAIADRLVVCKGSQTFQDELDLGFAHFAAGEYGPAQKSFERAKAKSATDDDRIESVYWSALAGWRAGTTPVVQGVDELKIEKNQAYLNLIRLEQKKLDAAAVEKMLGTPGADSMVLHFGLGDWYRRQGNAAAARQHWQKVIEQPNWSLPIYIAAEAELARLPEK